MTKDNPQAIWDKIQKGTFLVAEIGKGFIQTKEDRPVEEYLENAKTLVDEAAKAGADAVKFQTHNVEDEQLSGVDVSGPHFDHDRYAWVDRNNQATPIDKFWLPLREHCAKCGVVFFSTPMSRGAAKILDEVGTNLWKVASCDVLDFPLLDYMRRSDKPIIISSGMSNLDEVKKAVAFLRAESDKVALLHCVSIYPCDPEDLRLGTMSLLKDKFGDVPIGFSDHSLGIEAPLTAVAMGAKIIEKHFTLDRKLWGSDHKVAMTPVEFKEMVNRVRELEADLKKKRVILATDFAQRSMEQKIKTLQEDEAAFRGVFFKGLVAGTNIPIGTVITADMVYAMRPRSHIKGSASDHYELVLGKLAPKDYKKYDPIDHTTFV